MCQNQEALAKIFSMHHNPACTWTSHRSSISSFAASYMTHGSNLQSSHGNGQRLMVVSACMEQRLSSHRIDLTYLHTVAESHSVQPISSFASSSARLSRRICGTQSYATEYRNAKRSLVCKLQKKTNNQLLKLYSVNGSLIEK